jgi:hypothetical protein
MADVRGKPDMKAQGSQHKCSRRRAPLSHPHHSSVHILTFNGNGWQDCHPLRMDDLKISSSPSLLWRMWKAICPSIERHR